MNTQEKQTQIIDMFNQIAPSYDKANRVMSLGIDISWRKEACKVAFEALGSKRCLRLVDVACGTGDMLLHWQNEARSLGCELGEIVGIDPSEGMLEVARQKLAHELDSDILHLQKGEAKALGLESSSVEILSIAYGLRNVVELDKALEEFARVLKSGGILVILDFFNNSSTSLLDRAMRFYTRRILPYVGGFISKNYAAYKYLPNSIEGFVSNDELKSKLESLGISCHVLKGYSANISTLYVGVKQ